MTSRFDVERELDRYLADGPEQVADRVVDAALDQVEHTSQRRPSWLRWISIRDDTMNRIGIVALGVAAAVVLSVGVFAALAGAPTPEGTGSDPSDVRAGPVEVAAAYIAARNAFDADRARQLIADDFTTTEAPDGFQDASNLELAFEWHEALDIKHARVECREVEPGKASPAELAVVSCSTEFTSVLQRIAEYPPEEAEFTFEIRDGRVAWVGYTNPLAFYGVWYDEFLVRHSDFRSLVTQAHNLDPDATRQVIEQLPEYLALFEDWMADPEASSQP